MTRPPLRVIDGTGPDDPVSRRQRFEQAHPEAVILPPAAGRWRAVVPPGLIPGDGTSDDARVVGPGGPDEPAG